MKIENIRVFGFEPSFRGMRNPMDSWRESDSTFYSVGESSELWDSLYGKIRVPERPIIGPRDMDLACKLIQRGSEHRKFMRQIIMWMDITIPRYVWQELDTLKVATVRNSCSTMNKLGSRDLDQGDFQLPIQELTLKHINKLGKLLREAKEGDGDVRQARRLLKNDLPEGFLQKATYSMSYETVLICIFQRENHRLPEWRLESQGSITQVLLSLPYMARFYEAATRKRNQLRECAADLAAMIAQIKEGNAIIKTERLEDLHTRLKKAI